MVLEDGAPILLLGTEIVNYPRKKICRLTLCAGEGLHRCRDMFGLIERWAKQNGCQGLEAVGRKGWERFFGDWNAKVFLEKDFD